MGGRGGGGGAAPSKVAVHTFKSPESPAEKRKNSTEKGVSRVTRIDLLDPYLEEMSSNHWEPFSVTVSRSRGWAQRAQRGDDELRCHLRLILPLVR